MRILVLDDSDIMRDVVVNSLVESGLPREVITEAASGVEAIRLVNSDTFDLFILDIVMDGIDGVAVLKEIKKVQPAAKVIMCSTFSKSETVRDLIDLGIDDFIVKPFTRERLKDTTFRYIHNY
ncbi:MAG: two-component system response regulator [Firmicutes bacterium]|nr:two-component system response regulator [Bacillota bacterium]